jgi:predicted RNase H-like HicB family nuclease
LDIGLIHKDTDSHFGVSFPDFPGVVTAGTNLDDARAMAEEALTFHIEGLVEDGEAIPSLQPWKRLCPIRTTDPAWLFWFP